MITIKLTTKDLKKDFSANEEIIDNLAYSIDDWTQEDLYANNHDYELENISRTVIDEFDFEESCLNYLNNKTEEEAEAILRASSKADLELYKKQDLKLGAFIALNFLEWFDNEVKKYKEKNIEDINLGETGIKELQKQIEEARDSFRTDVYNEWLYGDRSSSGVIEKIREAYKAEELNYNEEEDIATFIFDEEELHETYCGCYEDEQGECEMWKSLQENDIKEIKSWLVNDIYNSSNELHLIKIEESKKRKIEREKQAKYRQERKEEELHERNTRLKAMKK